MRSRRSWGFLLVFIALMLWISGCAVATQNDNLWSVGRGHEMQIERNIYNTLLVVYWDEYGISKILVYGDWKGDYLGKMVRTKKGWYWKKKDWRIWKKGQKLPYTYVRAIVESQMLKEGKP